MQRSLKILTVSLMGHVHDCHRPDDGNGGSQGSLLIFERTANTFGHTVYSEQRNWHEKTQQCTPSWHQGARFIGITPTLVVLMRRCDARFAGKYKQFYPKSKIVCWIKDDNTVTDGLVGSPAFLDAAFIVSKSAAKKSMRVFGTPPGKLHVIYNPFRENTDWYDQLRKHANVNVFHIIATGKPDHKTLRSIMKRLVRADSRFKVHLCAAKWRRDASSGNIPNAIYHGNIEHTKVLKLLSTCFVQVNPTKSVETFGYSFAESNVLGIPVVSNHVRDSTTEEMLSHWNENVILPNLDVRNFVKSILNIHHRAVAGNTSRKCQWPLVGHMNASQFVMQFITTAMTS